MLEANLRKLTIPESMFFKYLRFVRFEKVEIKS